MRKREDYGFTGVAEEIIKLSDKPCNESKSRMKISFTNNKPSWKAHKNTPLINDNPFFY